MWQIGKQPISNYEEWENAVHSRIRAEAIWSFFGYRKALFLYDLTWQDCERLSKDVRGHAISRQLIRSVGSISANMEEGHGRGFGKERNYFLNVALGSARESKGWFWRSHNLLFSEVLDHRLALLDEIIALLVTELRRHRQQNRTSG